MTTFRRVVTGHAPDGKSIIASDTAIPSVAIPGLAGIELTTLWGADAPYHYPDDGTEASRRNWFPPVGGVRFISVVLPPDDTPADTSLTPDEIFAAAERLVPGLMGHFDEANPGMHRSATTDMLYVLSGRCVLELDDGSKTELHAGNVVVQSGTNHRWKNPWSEPCHVIGCTVGALLANK